MLTRIKQTRTTVHKLCATFLALHTPHQRPTTQRMHRVFVREYIDPSLGKVRVPELTRTAVRAWHAAIGATGKRATANRSLSVLSAAWNLGQLEWGLVDARLGNPCRGVKRFPEPRRKKWMEPSAIAVFLRGLELAAENRKTRLRRESVDATRFLVLTGWRSSEVLELRWSQIDFVTSCVVFDETKTVEQVRPIGRQALDLLRSLRGTTSGDGRVFPGRNPGRPISTLRGAIRSALLHTDICEWHYPHSFRHSFISNVIATSGNPIDAQLLAGHAQLKTTLTYTHVSATQLREIATATCDLFTTRANRDPISDRGVRAGGSRRRQSGAHHAVE